MTVFKYTVPWFLKAHEQYGYTLEQIGEAVGMHYGEAVGMHYTSVSRAMKRVRERVKQ